MKICTACRRELPATLDYFHRHPRSPDGLKPRCKQCRRTEETARYQQPRVKAAAIRQAAAWVKENPEKRRTIIAKHYRRCLSRPRRRMLARLEHLVREDLISRGYIGKIGWPFGYSLDECMAHLESNFQPGMSWANHGRWHVDHIRPRSSFLYSSPLDRNFVACWALSNLQPLWAEENLRKGAKWAS